MENPEPSIYSQESNGTEPEKMGTTEQKKEDVTLNRFVGKEWLREYSIYCFNGRIHNIATEPKQEQQETR